MKDTALIVAHLLGCTSSLDLARPLSPEEITAVVAQAVQVALEIERQVDFAFGRNELEP